MSENNPYESPDTLGKSPPPKRRNRKSWLIEIAAVVVVIGLLIALLLPAVRFTPAASRRMQCSNNLKMIGLALHNYELEYHALPPAYTVDDQGRRLHSWRTLILPYLEQRPLYEKIDLTKPWDDPANAEAFESEVSVYRCPSANGPATHATYLAVVGRGCCFQPTEPRKLSEITDAHEATLMVIECDLDQSVHWMSPKDIGEQEILSRGQPAEPSVPLRCNAAKTTTEQQRAKNQRRWPHHDMYVECASVSAPEISFPPQ